MNSQINDTSSHIRVMDHWQETLPEDLYIPPAAFEILLDHFEGPFDFLIYLIQKNGFDLLKLDISPIATQYLAYIESMKSLNIELTADYMVMAALLADLKSRLLLPKPKNIQLEKDPRQALIQRLEDYVRIKQAAEKLAEYHVLDRDTFTANVALTTLEQIPERYSVDLLHSALRCLFNRPEPVIHHVQSEKISLEDKIKHLETILSSGHTLEFAQLLEPTQGKMGMVVTFMAILELTRQQKVKIVATGVESPLAICGSTTA